MKKIIVIGLGNVGFTYVNIAVARGLEAQWIFVDRNEDIAFAHAKDFSDMVSILPRNGSTFKVGTLEDHAADADIVVVCASIPANKDFSDRLALAGANAKLMDSFGSVLKEKGFKGVVIVAANPCDVMAAVFHYASGLPANKVISAGTILDGARLKKLISHRYNVEADSIEISMIAEHGASAMAVWSNAKIGETLIKDLPQFTEEVKQKLYEDSKKEAFEIFSRKGNTQFGIGTSLYEITSAVLNNKRKIMTIGVKLPDTFKHPGIYFSIPVIVGENGYEYLPEKMSLTPEEWEKFDKFSEGFAKVHNDTLGQIGVKHIFK
ncbi:MULTISPECIES: lactate/malate family dehydrogenase [unclassified Mycoplasma]|uniref:lactate/malate family dehydrogenase n=1 Tax=unclassified Mycoplasma TaxID=2683645 RepID=UPI00216AE0A9|nr:MULTISPECIES: NAD(P)-binding domain-containing protein [unclassified Mycoplasma]MCS4536785.1 NAD(P)-binding domain-containing protein [Mycoplasma sp. CSL7475-4]MCT4469903.1 NAD(P)-binding domain-containing protein [Mycoplasma sp. HS2188]